MKKINFRKGTGTAIYGFIIMMLTFLIALICIEQYAKYNNALKTQTAADSISDSVAVYAMMNNCTYDEALNQAEYVKQLVQDKTGVEVKDITLDEEQFALGIISVDVTGRYKETSNIDDVYTNTGNNDFYYEIKRHSATSYVTTRLGTSGDGLYSVVDKDYLDSRNYIPTITSGFGYRNLSLPGASKNHTGVDIACPEGTPVLACYGGTVAYAEYHPIMGNFVVINCGKYDGVEILMNYHHNSRLLVLPGQEVLQGQVIAYSGNTGISSGPHLHFSIRENLTYVDPELYLGTRKTEETDEEN